MLDASAIAWQLSQRAEDLVHELFPDARQQGRELRWHGRDGAVWSMRTAGGKQGVWANWADPERQAGDALELVHHALFPDELGRRDSLRWAARWLGIAEHDYDPHEALRLRRLAVEALTRRAMERDAARERVRRDVVAAYVDDRRSVPVPLSTELASYLRGRGCALDDLAGVPRSLRFTPALVYDRYRRLPAMLAPIYSLASGKHVATHVTYLRQAADGVWRKADVDTPKKVFGSWKNGIIPLLRGVSDQPFAQAPDGDRLLIAEGIENALCASFYVDAARVVACVTVGNLPLLTLPPQFRTVILAYDRDGENNAVMRAREALYRRLLADGRVVETIKPRAGLKDFAELVLAEIDRVGVA